MRHSDLLFFNPHLHHGNTPYENAVEGYERVSLVYYFRERIVKCKSAAEELAKANLMHGSVADKPPAEPKPGRRRAPKAQATT